MEELKEILKEKTDVKQVHFAENGDWFIYATPIEKDGKMYIGTIEVTKTLSVDEILSEKKSKK
jgi:hypothetical protein